MKTIRLLPPRFSHRPRDFERTVERIQGPEQRSHRKHLDVEPRTEERRGRIMHGATLGGLHAAYHPVSGVGHHEPSRLSPRDACRTPEPHLVTGTIAKTGQRASDDTKRPSGRALE